MLWFYFSDDMWRRNLAAGVVGLLLVVAFLVSWWAFVHWNIVVATIVCIVSVVTAFIVALWAVGRMLPAKVRLER